MSIFLSKAKRIDLLGFDDRWLILLGIWPLAGVSTILTQAIMPLPTSAGPWICYSISLLFCAIYWTVCRAMLIYFHHRYPKESQLTRRLAWTASGMLIVVLLITSFSTFVIFRETATEATGLEEFTFKVVMSATLSVTIIAIYEGVYFFSKFKRTALEREQLAKQNMQAQLSVLKQQMNPHFLFNSLNTLVNLIPEDTVKAGLFTQRLAAVYRRILEYRSKELIELREEWVALQDYIYLMQTRFEDKLRIHFVVEGRPQGTGQPLPALLGHQRIVPLSAQLLVENAIKHNVVSAAHPLNVLIELSEGKLTVTNDHKPRERNFASTGWGHENLRGRYAAVTDRPVIIEQADSQYRVIIPLIGPRSMFPVSEVA